MSELTRKPLPDTRVAINHKFMVGHIEGYLNVGFYEDGSPGEIFITLAKEGSTLSGFADTLARITSLCLQYGLPIEVLCQKLQGCKFEPSGATTNPEIPVAESLVDYIYRWLQMHTTSNERPRPNTTDPSVQSEADTRATGASGEAPSR
jgi:ribonucleoside-diphosphate reductase alpha chain